MFMHGLLPLVLICSSSLVLLAATTNADDILRYYITSDCPDDMNYTRGGAFQANLDALLSSLPAAASSTGFAVNVTGAAPDQAFGLAQCRGDVSAADCRSCLNYSATEMASACPGQKSAVLIYEGCLLRYSNASFFGVADTRSESYVCSSWAARADFSSPLGTLMSDLAEKAYGSPRMFAVGAVNHTAYEKMYGMARCTRDLDRDDCHSCLAKAVRMIPDTCPGKSGGRIFYWSCSIRYEVGPFYNIQAAEAAMSPAPAPAPGSGGPLINKGAGSSHMVRNTALLVSIPVAITLLLLLVVVYICENRKPHKHVEIARGRYADDEEMRSSGPLQYDLSTLRAATDNFSEANKLGQGGFGPVYKGMLENGQEIAVKRLSEISKQGLVEMENEIVLVGKLQHKNLVRLLGFCIEEKEKLLVYEFLRNKSLDKIIFGTARQQGLSWGQRKKIIEGIARGLTYLHEDSRLTVIHRDLKAGNILLDMDMNPKISDFGLASGYMAPEYAHHGIFSAKSDIFSYCVLVLEIITGRRAYEDLLKFVSCKLVWWHWSLGSVEQLLDGYPADEPGKQEMLRCIHIGLLCVQEDPQLRPSMASVLLMLKHRITTMSAPTKPAFVVLSVETPRVAVREPSSTNEVSVSDLEPR
ncbi:hypothetical protein HU200_024112 [Digitaria exilis]|uniref:non-specific serine/threonine protein kinase n=1 Tax=Digitaria exilis TaxID=1010633 RepID=A0A835BY26_9POAL|nr:hypothetical protein HU200_024112 [Digitaria exilis]